MSAFSLVVAAAAAAAVLRFKSRADVTQPPGIVVVCDKVTTSFYLTLLRLSIVRV